MKRSWYIDCGEAVCHSLKLHADVGSDSESDKNWGPIPISCLTSRQAAAPRGSALVSLYLCLSMFREHLIEDSEGGRIWQRTDFTMN